MQEPKPGKYKHYKGGLYEVLGVVNHSETLEKLVLYKHLDDGSLWVRPLQMFMENVVMAGKEMPRFQKIS